MVTKYRLVGGQRGVTRLAGLAVLAGALSSCGLDVVDPDVITPDDVSDPASLPIAITGVVGDWQLAHEGYARYSGMLVDEFISSGTFPTRVQVDARQMQSDNTSLNTDVYEFIHVVRFSSDNVVQNAQGLVGDPEADQDIVSEAIAVGQLYGGYARILLAEAYCYSILGGGDPENVNHESAPLLPDARMQDALSLLQAAEASATAAGFSDLANAARVGQARALMFVGDYSQAASIVANVSSGFTFLSEFSANDPSQYNGVYDFTYGDFNFIRWTVGDGTQPERNFEAWPYYDEWVDAGLIDPDPPGFAVSQNSSIFVHLQLIYGGGIAPPNASGQAAPILIASGFEADLIKAEAAYRAGDLTGAEAIINARLTTGDNPHGAVFDAVDLTGDLTADLGEIAKAFAAGTWLTGYRLGNIRRLLRNDGLDLYPNTQPGRDFSFPVSKQELDNNPDINAACPSGDVGSWPA